MNMTRSGVSMIQMALPGLQGRVMYRNIDEIKKANQDTGQDWFNPEFLQATGTRMHPVVYGGKYFITAEKHTTTLFRNDVETFMIRRCDEQGWVETVDVPHDNLEEAIEAIHKYIRGSGMMPRVRR